MYNIVFMQEIIFSILAMLCYIGTGIASAAYAAKWGKPPEVCAEFDDVLDDDDDDRCDSTPLTVTNALEAVSSM